MESPIGTLNEESYFNEVDGKKYYASKGAEFTTNPDPNHGFSSMNY